MEQLTSFCCLLKFLLLICIPRVNGQSLYPFVNTKSGEVIGRLIYYDDPVTKERIPVKEFLGIPYAQPPLEFLRFQKPVPVVPWSCSRLCHTMPNACTQYMGVPFPWSMSVKQYTSEDCLYLNIWVPNGASRSNKKSVFFWVHGGGFFTGSARQPIYQGHAMAAVGDVIVVVINYRLGSFGFWTNNGTDAPGNVGIWDTIMALRWVRDNIKRFGGDKNSITVGGESAGGVIVSLLTIAAPARGLFQRLIMQSGSAMWSLADSPLANYQRSQTVAERVGCANESYKVSDHPAEVTECMRGMDRLTLIYKEYLIDPTKANSFIPGWSDELFPRNPREVMLEGNFPITDLFIGDSGTEAACMITADNADIFGFFGEKDPKFDREDARNLLRKYFPFFNEEQMAHFIPPPDSNDPTVDENTDWRLRVADAFGDFFIECPNVFFATRAAQTGTKVYYYDFEHRPHNSVWADWLKTTHFNEVDFVFGGPLKQLFSYPEEEQRLSRMIITHWTNFVKYGKPTEDWPLYIENAETRVYNSSTSLSSGVGPHGSNCRWWNDFINGDQKIELPVPPLTS